MFSMYCLVGKAWSATPCAFSIGHGGRDARNQTGVGGRGLGCTFHFIRFSIPLYTLVKDGMDAGGGGGEQAARMNVVTFLWLVTPAYAWRER